MMTDILPRANRRWGIALIVLLCVSAVLFITPWICSTLFLTPFEWHEEDAPKVQRKQGSRILNCKPSGPCVSCSAAEKRSETKNLCTLTGYHQPFKCVEEKYKKASGETASRERKFERNGVGDGSLNFGADDVDVFHIYENCLPSDVREKLSVFGFEGVILASLAISAPIVYYRKKRMTPPSGMVRIPSSNTRF